MKDIGESIKDLYCSLIIILSMINFDYTSETANDDIESREHDDDGNGRLPIHTRSHVLYWKVRYFSEFK